MVELHQVGTKVKNLEFFQGPSSLRIPAFHFDCWFSWSVSASASLGAMHSEWG